MASTIDYAVAFEVDTNSYMYVNGIYTSYVTTSNSFDDSIKCSSSSDANVLAGIVGSIDARNPIVVQREVEYTVNSA